MSCLGMHIALTAEQEQDVWMHFYDERILDLVETFREDDGEEHRQRTDKAWDPIHRCLSDGTLGWDAGQWPLRGAILGSESLYFGGDFVVMLDAFDYAWYWFERMRAFFRRTADEGRAMLFTADQ